MALELNIQKNEPKDIAMFMTYFNLALRNFLKHKFFTFINIFGLALGIAASLLIFQYAYRELSYDRWQEHADNIYRIRLDRYSQGELAEEMATAPCALTPELKANFPEIIDYVRLSNFQLEGVISYGEKRFRIDNQAFFASESFFKVFSFPLIHGDPETCLKERNTVVLSEEMAEKLFGNTDPIGKSLFWNNRISMMVTGIFQKVDKPTHLHFDFLFSYETMVGIYGDAMNTQWFMDVPLSYFLFQPGLDPDEFSLKVERFIDERLGEELEKRNEAMKFTLQAFNSIHLYSNYPGEAEKNGNYKSVYFLLAISLMIILIAWLNYINLATSRSLERAREVGLRKVSGATKTQLITQFLLESLFINLIAVLLGLFFVASLYRLFNEFTGLEVSLYLWQKPAFWLVFGLVITTGSLLAGLYPAFVISTFEPISIFRMKKRASKSGLSFRKVMIITQFIITIILITGTLTVYRQMNFMRNQDPGIEIEQTLIVKCPAVFDSTFRSKENSFTEELLNSSQVEGICASFFVPGDEVWFTLPFSNVKDPNQRGSRTLCANFMNDGFVDLYQLKLIAGRNFDRNIQEDRTAYILSRKAAELLGHQNPEDVLNTELRNDLWNRVGKCVGVVEDYHQESLKEDFAPLVFIHLMHPRYSKNYSITLKTNNMKETIALIQDKYESFYPGNLFEYYFLDQHYEEQYKDDIHFGKTFGLFAIFAIIVASLGLFALALYFTLQRTREIAIRKIHGATEGRIMRLLTSEYIKLFIISAIIAFPLAIYIMNRWLNNFAHRIHFDAWTILIPGIIMLGIIFLAIIYQVVKSSKAKPVDALKYE